MCINCLFSVISRLSSYGIDLPDRDIGKIFRLFAQMIELEAEVAEHFISTSTRGLGAHTKLREVTQKFESAILYMNDYCILMQNTSEDERPKRITLPQIILHVEMERNRGNQQVLTVLRNLNSML